MPLFANTIDNNEIYAKRAECDAGGNNIQTTYATRSDVNTGLAGKQNTISDLSTIRSGAAAGATAVQPSDLATVATTGSYDDLSDKPTIPAAQVNSDWNSVSGVSQILNKPSLAAVATTGDYGDLNNKPSIPAAQVNSDWNASSGVSEILNKPAFATVATTGDYDDLTNKPSIPAAQVNADWNSSSGVSEILNKPTIPSGSQLVPAATSADVDKVLTVDAQGTPAWSAAQAPISAGNMLSVTNNVLNVTTTAGITDIQMVSELPAQTVATVVYLIPET